MPKQRARDVSVGAFLVLGLAVLAVAIMAVGGESRLFSRKVRYRAVFPSTDGLLVGSPVKMAGVQVGSVVAIRLPTDPESSGIEVTLGIDRDYAERVRRDSRAATRFLQYLSGEKYVEVNPGSPSQPAVEPNDFLASVQEAKMLEQGEDIADNLNEITVALREILAPIQRGEGLLGQMIHDPNFGREGLEAMKGALRNVETLTQRVNDGQGLAGRLLYDPKLAGTADDLARAVHDLATFVEGLNRREGAVGSLLEEGGAGERAVEDLRESAASLKEVASRLASKEGLFGRLLNDPEYSEAAARDLRETLANVRQITRKINEGQGTLGALVNERVLHDSMEEVVAGVGDSKFARWLLRHYQKQGIEAPPSPAP